MVVVVGKVVKDGVGKKAGEKSVTVNMGLRKDMQPSFNVKEV